MSSEERIERCINEYIIRYMAKHQVSKEEAKAHMMVKLATAYFKEDNNENRSYQVQGI